MSKIVCSQHCSKKIITFSTLKYIDNIHMTSLRKFKTDLRDPKTDRQKKIERKNAYLAKE